MHFINLYELKLASFENYQFREFYLDCAWVLQVLDSQFWKQGRATVKAEVVAICFLKHFEAQGSPSKIKH